MSAPRTRQLPPPPPLVFADWVKEEMAELEAQFESDPAALDAILDAIGALCALMALYSPEAVSEAIRAYIDSQRRRGRAVAHWYAVMEHLDRQYGMSYLHLGQAVAQAGPANVKARMDASMRVFIARLQRLGIHVEGVTNV